MKVAAPWNIMATYCNYHHNYQGHRIKNKKGGWHCDQSLTSSYHLVRWMQIKGQVLFEDGEETPKKQTWHLLLYDFDSSCPSPTLLPPFPVNVSEKKKNNGGWHPDTSGLTRATPRPERSQAQRRLNGKKIPPPQKKPPTTNATCLHTTNLLVYHPTGNSGDVCLLSLRIKQCWSAFPFTQLSLQ